MINIGPLSGRRCFPPPTPALFNEIYLSGSDCVGGRWEVAGRGVIVILLS